MEAEKRGSHLFVKFLIVGLLVGGVGGFFLGQYYERLQWRSAMTSVSKFVENSVSVPTPTPEDNEAEIRSNCTDETKEALRKADTGSLSRGTKDDAVLLINSLYRMCLTKNGMKPEDML